MRDSFIKGPAHDARHRIPSKTKSEKLALVCKDARYYQSIVSRSKTCSGWRWDEKDKGIWVPRSWVDDDAVDYARQWLRVKVFSGSGTKTLGITRQKREDEFGTAITALTVLLGNLGDPDIAAFVKYAREQSIPALERAYQAAENRGKRQTAGAPTQWRSKESSLPRYRLIAQTVDIIRKRYTYRPTRAFMIVAEALRKEKATPSRKESVARIWRHLQQKTKTRVN